MLCFDIYIFFSYKKFFSNLHLDRVDPGARRVRSIVRRYWANRVKTREEITGVHYEREHCTRIDRKTKSLRKEDNDVCLVEPERNCLLWTFATARVKLSMGDATDSKWSIWTMLWSKHDRNGPGDMVSWFCSMTMLRVIRQKWSRINHKCTWTGSGTLPGVLNRPDPVWLLLVCIDVAPVARVGWASTLQNFQASRKLTPGMVFGRASTNCQKGGKKASKAMEYTLNKSFSLNALESLCFYLVKKSPAIKLYTWYTLIKVLVTIMAKCVGFNLVEKCTRKKKYGRCNDTTINKT